MNNLKRILIAWLGMHGKRHMIAEAMHLANLKTMGIGI